MKDFRPINLTFFEMKTLERLLDTDLRTIIKKGSFFKFQNAYLKGKSTVTDLHQNRQGGNQNMFGRVSRALDSIYSKKHGSPI